MPAESLINELSVRHPSCLNSASGFFARIGRNRPVTYRVLSVVIAYTQANTDLLETVTEVNLLQITSVPRHRCVLANGLPCTIEGSGLPHTGATSAPPSSSPPSPQLTGDSFNPQKDSDAGQYHPANPRRSPSCFGPITLRPNTARLTPTYRTVSSTGQRNPTKITA